MKRIGLFALLLAVALQRVALSAPYSIADLGTLGGAQSEAFGINSLGQVVGWADIPNGDGHAFLYSNGAMIDLGALFGVAGTYSIARSINDAGQVVGIFNNMWTAGIADFLYSGGSMFNYGPGYAYGINNSGQFTGVSTVAGHGFIASYGTYSIDLGGLGDSGSVGYAINDAGQVTGASYLLNYSPSGTPITHAFLYTSGVMKDLGTLGGQDSTGYAINASGQIVGSSSTSTGGLDAFLYSGGVMTDLGALGGGYSEAYGINDSGQIVGYSLYPGQSQHAAFLYSGGVMVDLNGLLPDGSGWNLLSAQGINDSGQITGYGKVNGQIHAFLLTPVETSGSVPEPSTVGLLSIGAAALAVTRRRNRANQSADLLDDLTWMA